MVSQYPAELPGSTSEVLHSSMPDVEVPPVSLASAPVAAVSNVDAMTLHTQPGVPDISGKPEKKVKEKGISYFSLFRHADGFDVILMILGSLGALANGAAMPMFTLVFGQTLNTLGGSLTNVDAFLHQVSQVALYFTYLAIGSLFVSYAEIGLWMWTGTRQANRIRQRFLTQALVMDVSYFDLHASSGHLMQGLNDDCVSIQKAIGEKVGNTMHHVATFATGIAIAFTKGWAMTLVLIAVLPLLAVTMSLLVLAQGRLQRTANNAYASANSLVQESFAAIRTVLACTAGQRSVERYSQSLVEPERAGIRSAMIGAASVAALNGIFPWAWALALWYGSTRVEDGSYSGGQVVTVLLSAIIGGASIGQAGPNLQYFQNGCVAAKRVFDVIDRRPDIDDRAAGEEPEVVKGELHFKDVGFAYPSRPEVQVLSSLSFTVRPGQTVAFVGESGSGKSTIIQLLQRFYDPLHGQVLLDGRDIRQLQLRWYRHQLGLVSQEPVLFSATISQNISYGNPGVDQAGIEAAARAAHCHGFIIKLPLGYDTPVGERGIQLSGGQKQRVAIARAIARNPRVLLLDEATAALDTRSERAVQAALDGLMAQRTTVIVAHRLSTIVNASSIAVVRSGAIVEQGSHAHLLEHHPDGAYATLLKLQLQAQEADKADALDINGDDAVPPDALQQLQKSELGQERPSSWRIAKHGSTKAILKEVLTEPVADVKAKSRTWRSRLRLRKSKKDASKPKAKSASFWRIAKYNKPEWLYGLVATVGSALQGAIMPFFAVALSSLIGSFYSTDMNYLKHQTTKWCLVLVGIGAISFTATAVQQYGFGVVGQRLTRRLRVLLYAAIMRQDIAFFDKDENSSGALSSELAVDTTHIRGAVGDQVGLIAQNVTSFIAGYIIAFIASWKVTLVLSAILPLIIFAAVAGQKYELGSSDESHKLYSLANQTATEAFSSIRTVAAFSLGPHLSAQYRRAMRAPSRAAVVKSNTAGASFGTSQFILYASYGLIFWYGGQLIKDHDLTLTNLLKVFFAIILAAVGVSNAQMAFPDVAEAGEAIKRVFGTLDRVPTIDSGSSEGLQPSRVEGRLELDAVSFAYPSRPEVPVFTDFCLTVEPGQTVALVGPSGSGKSTVIALIERWYNPTAGRILLDGVDITTLNINWWRSCIGLVGQEPVLFSGTIAENIAYGCATPPSQEEIVAAARAANALSFIEQAPDGFNTRLGDGGGIALSGGQKQRVSIARALARNPRLLLLDEASSALDAASERLVQDALAALQAGRTTLVIAHRLSTIREASSIAVVQDGKILEQGTHQQLMRMPGGSYAGLVQHQQAA